MKNFRYPLPSGDVFTVSMDVSRWGNPEINQVLRRIENADLLYDSLRKLVMEMAPVNLITQSETYREAMELLSILE